MTSQLDNYDLKILRELQREGRLATKQVAQRVGLSLTPVYERIKRLEQEGYIDGYHAVLNAERLGRGFIVFCHVKLQKMSGEVVNKFQEWVKGVEEVTECYNVSGAFDFQLKVHAADMKRYHDFLLSVLGAFPGIGSVESTFVMKQVKHSYGIPV
ncbi:MAG: Lrp/AsnC family transcriptional regulator [Bacteroidales bacterium]|nr:Lrp/AsnC family transcriptional regulator [Bacteroidales bacterium]